MMVQGLWESLKKAEHFEQAGHTTIRPILNLG
jgi:hypothetical protein